MSVRIQIRRDTGTNWSSANTVLAEGEIGLNTTNDRFKIGDGTTAWNSLAYAAIDETFLEERLASEHWHQPVRLATAAVLPNTPSYTAGTTDEDGGTGIGAKLESSSNARLSVDGVEAVTGNRILVKNQADASQNGIYDVTAQGSGSAHWILTRSADMNGSVAGQITVGESVGVREGTNNYYQQFAISSIGTGTGGIHIIDTDDITFVQWTGVASFNAGNGLATSGNTLNVGTADSARIVVNSDNIDLAPITQSDNSGAAGLTFVSAVSRDGYGRVLGITTSDAQVTLGTNTTGSFVQSLVAGTGVSLANNSGENAQPTISIGQAVGTTDSVTFNTVTANLTGNVTGNVTGSSGSTTGNAATATALQTSRTIELTGDVTGSASFDGTATASISATIAANSVALGTDTTGDYVSSLVAGTGVTVTNNSGEGATPTIAIGQAVGTGASVGFAQVTTTGALYVGTDIHVGGTYYTTTETNLAIEDSFIYLNDGNTISDPDLGFAGNYNDGTYRHAGLFSDASDSHKFKFFKGLTIEPTNPINTAHASYTPADVSANTFQSTVATGSAPLVVASTTAVTNLNADLLDGQHGSYYAPINNASFTGTFSAPTGTITSTMIADGTIVNADISATAAIDLGKLADVSTNAQTASYTLVLADKNKVVEMGVGTANNLTVPLNSSQAFPVGSQINILQTGAGQTTIVATGGVTINATPGLKMRAQWSYATLIKRATDTWVLVGDISA